MNTNDRHENDTGTAQTLQTPGAILKDARQKKGLSQQDIANRLNLRLTLIRDIEADRFDQKTASTFTKGYLKTYAHFVGVDDHLVLSAYERLGIQEQQYSTTMYSFSGRTKREASETRVRVISWVLCIGLIVAGGVWWWMQPVEESVPTSVNEAGQLVVKDGQKGDGKQASPDSNPESGKAVDQTAQAVASDTDSHGDNSADAAQNTDQNQPAADGDHSSDSVLSDTAAPKNGDSEQGVAPVEQNHNAAAQTSATATPNATSQTGNTNQGTDNNSAANASPAPTTGTPADASQTASATNVALSLQFSGSCWLKVTDATGKSLLEGTRKAGDKAELSGKEPFNLIIGAPRVVTVMFHGQPVDMTSFIRRGVVARYQLPIKS